MIGQYIALALFTCFQLLFLTSLPIVNDESMYLHWGNEFLRFWADPRMPLSLQGKQALTAITLGLAQQIPIDPLIAGRLTSTIFTCITFLATMWIAKQFLSKPGVIVTAILLATSPLLLFFNRLALPDTAVSASFMCALALTISLIEKPKLRTAIFLGLVIAIGWWFKSTALLAIPALIITGIYKKNIYVVFAVIIGLLMSIGLIQTPWLARVAPLAATGHVFTISELLGFPWQVWWKNIVKAFEAIVIMSSPLGILIASSFTRANGGAKLKMQFRIVIIWFVTPIIIEIFMAHIFNLRYITLAIPAYILMVAYALERLPKWTTLTTVGTSAVLAFLLITQPLMFFRILAPIPAIQLDIQQYTHGWSSGWGVKDAADYLRSQATKQPIFVFVRADSGNPEDGMYVYLQANPNIRVLPISYLDTIIAATISNPNTGYFFVSRGTQMSGLENHVKEVARFNKPMDNEYVGVFEIKR